MADTLEDSLAQTLGTPVTIKIKGKEYNVTPITLTDLAELEQYTRKQRVDQFRDSSKGTEADERILFKLQNQKITINEAMDIGMTTLSGSLFLLFRVLKGNKGVTPENVGTLFGLNNLGDITIVLDVACETLTIPPAAEVKEVGSP